MKPGVVSDPAEDLVQSRTADEYSGGGGPDQRPILFVHIPKTAGTTFLTALGALFGEQHLRRLQDDDLHPDAIDALIGSPAMTQVRCLAGHFPVHAFAERWERFQAFTMLRHPVDRVVSLFWFLRRSPEDVLARMGLTPGFSLDEFLAGEVPELFAQTRDGMCRMLCGDPTRSDPGHPAFWRPQVSAVAPAAAALERMGFGLVEEMGASLRLVAAEMGAPFALPNHAENVSSRLATPPTSGQMRRIVDLNTADLALYEMARRRFQRRVAVHAARGADGSPPRPDAVWKAELGRETPICAVAGRRGFHAYEPRIGLAWIRGDRSADVAFAVPAGRRRLVLRVYGITQDYPIGDLRLHVNGVAVRHRVVRDRGGWAEVRTRAFRIRDGEGPNLLSLSPPFQVPAARAHPGSRDERALSVAIATLRLDRA